MIPNDQPYPITITLQNATVLSGNICIPLDWHQPFNRSLPFEEKITFPFLEELLGICSDEELRELCMHLAEVMNYWAHRKNLLPAFENEEQKAFFFDEKMV